MNGVIQSKRKVKDYVGGFRTGSAELPELFCLPEELTPDVRDQGAVNSCVGFAITNIMQILNQVETGERERFSAGYVYGKCRDEGDERQGMVVQTALDRLIKTGAPFEKYFPENEEVPKIIELVKSRPHLTEKAEPYKIAGYEVYAWALKDKKYQAVKEALYKHKTPILGAFEMKNGAHAMAIVGWNDRTKKFRVVNSWNKDWGEAGIGDVAYSKLSRGYLILDAKNSNSLMPFEDVPETEWYYNAVKTAYNAGLMNGTANSTFEPERAITRAEMAQVLCNLCDKIDDIMKGDK